MSFGSSPGTLSSAARTIAAVRSSGRMSFSEPCWPGRWGTGLRETITASGMEDSDLSVTWAAAGARTSTTRSTA